MSRENLHSIIIELPKEENDYLRKITENISKEIGLTGNKDKFHITIEQTLYCNRGFRVGLNNWLGLQNPFELTLNRIDYFKHRKGRLIYLTTADRDERDKISDLHYGIHEIIKSPNLNKQNNAKFIPHVALFSGVSSEKVKTLESVLLEEIDHLKVPIREVIVEKKIDNYNWKRTDRISLGVNLGNVFDESIMFG